MYPLSICSHLSYAVVYAQSKKGALGCVCARACVDRVYTMCILFWGLFWILLILLGVVKFYSSTAFCSSHGRHTCVADKKKGGCFDDCYPSAEILTTRPAPALSHAHAYSLDSASLSLLGEPLVTSGCASDGGSSEVVSCPRIHQVLSSVQRLLLSLIHI